AGNFKEGHAKVNLGGSKIFGGGRWGYIDKMGRYIADPIFKDGKDFSGGLAMVIKNGDSYFTYINQRGKIIWQPNLNN
ncbi:MAG: WG repeat-containing protein, partial [candidate division WOR-3 bacterium]